MFFLDITSGCVRILVLTTRCCILKNETQSFKTKHPQAGLTARWDVFCYDL